MSIRRIDDPLMTLRRDRPTSRNKTSAEPSGQIFITQNHVSRLDRHDHDGVKL